MRIFRNAKVITQNGIFNKTVITDKGKIIDICDRTDIKGEVIDCKNKYLAPGLVDLHVHGGGGYSAMSSNPDDIVAMCKAHALHGVTSITPTTLAAQIPDLRNCISTILNASEKSSCSNILGVHLEGPFISPNMKGAQSLENILPPTESNFKELLEDGKGITMIGAAPEVDGAFNLSEYASSLGITVSAAHTCCSFENAEEALKHGFSDVTHLYSACSQMHKEGIYRKVGIVEAALCYDGYTTQFIADMRHIPAGAVKLIYKCKGADKAYPISDGLEFSASDISEGATVCQENGQAAICENGVMLLADKSCLAGSIASGDILLRNLYKTADIPLTDAVRMMTSTPLSVINYKGKKGKIEKGYDSDIIIFDEDINISFVQNGDHIVVNKL